LELKGRSEVGGATSSWIIEVEEADFERDVIERSREKPVVVDFWAEWCGPCRMLGPLLDKIAEEQKGAFILAKVNIDRAQSLAVHFGVEVIPTVKAFRNGQPILGFTGVLPEAQLRDFISRILPSEVDNLAQQARAAEGANPQEAERLYRQILDRERDHDGAIVGLARLLIARGQDREAADWLGRTGPGGDYGEEVQRLNAMLTLRQAAEGIAEEAVLRPRVKAEPNNAELRYQLGCVLAAAERYPEALAMLLSAAELDRKLAATKVREVMVEVFHIIGVRHPLADEFRDKLGRLLY
jgi:putative thioredoxin